MNLKLGGSLLVLAFMACGKVQEQPLGDTVGTAGEDDGSTMTGGQGGTGAGGAGHGGATNVSGGKSGGAAGKASGGAGAGAGGSAGAAPTIGGAGGTPAACDPEVDCEEVNYCGPNSLAALCDGLAVCPTEDAMLASLAAGPQCYRIQPTNCGTELVRLWGPELGSVVWGFDENGQAIYSEQHTELPRPCEDGRTMSTVTHWGTERCFANGVASEYCDLGAGGAGGNGFGGASSGD